MFSVQAKNDAKNCFKILVNQIIWNKTLNVISLVYTIKKKTEGQGF